MIEEVIPSESEVEYSDDSNRQGSFDNMSEDVFCDRELETDVDLKPCRRYGKTDDPLREPLVRYGMKQVKINSSQLISLSVKELNRRLACCSAPVVAKLKKCRRTLKNRGYAKNCRIKRIEAKNHLEQLNSHLMNENEELKHRNKILSEQLDQYKLRQCHPSETNTQPQSLPQTPPTNSYQRCDHDELGYGERRQDFNRDHYYVTYAPFDNLTDGQLIDWATIN